MKNHERNGSMKQLQVFRRSFWPGRSIFSPTRSQWQHLAGRYLAATLVVATGIGITFLGASLLAHFYFSVSVLLLATLFVSLFWGVGPGLLASLLSCGTLGYFSSLPQTVPGLAPLSWELLFRLLPFATASLFIAFITGQREGAHRLLQKRAEELATINQELEQANHFKDYFMIRVAHELRTPLTTILGEAQLILRRLKKAERTVIDCQRNIEKIEARASHLRTLVEDLVEISSLHAEKTTLRTARCDFRKICHEVIEDQQASSGRRITAQIPSQPLYLQADCERISSVVINLVENAVHYSLEQTIIHVCVSTDQTGILLQVSNEGPELSLEERARIFEPFYRTPYAENVFREGWGLGLAVCQEIVSRHHGHIWVTPAAGKGTTFLMHLPFQSPT